ncbi:MAG: TauD/TfdA dioxygenase family protein [Acidimicrobiales bacterium]
MANESSTLEHRPISPRFGSELDGVTLLDLTDSGVEALKQLGAERGVLVARDQVMTKEQQAEFAHRLGELTMYPVKEDGALPELLTIHADGNSKHVAGQGWHTDISSEAKPPALSMLRMEIVPDSGGDTLFADMHQAFETLSPEMQGFLLRLTARHDPTGHYLYLSGEKTLKELPSQVHPVIRTHPLTGRKALYVNSAFTGRIQELSRVESKSLLDMLYQHITTGIDFQIRVRWEANTVVFWDNRCVQHHAAWDYFPQVRHGYRATAIGEVPYLEH